MNINFKEKTTNKLKEIRSESGTSQTKLAEEIGVTRQTIIAIEKGSYTPSVLLALKLAKYFNMKVEDIFDYE